MTSLRTLAALLASSTALVACGGTSATSGGTTPDEIAERELASTDRCAVIERTGPRADDAIVVASIDARYGIVLPGTGADWEPRCIADDPNELFVAIFAGDRGALGASLADVEGPPMASFDERRFFDAFVPLMIASRRSQVRALEDLGVETLANGHLVWFAYYATDTTNGPIESVHGYSVRPLEGSHVLIGHVSATATTLDRDEAKSVVRHALEYYGTPEDLERVVRDGPSVAAVATPL